MFSNKSVRPSAVVVKRCKSQSSCNHAQKMRKNKDAYGTGIMYFRPI